MAIESEKECCEQDFVYYTPTDALKVVRDAMGSQCDIDVILSNPPLSKETNNVK